MGCGQVDAAHAQLSATLARAHSLQQRSVQVRCLTGLGLTALARGDRDSAVQSFEAAIEGFEEQRRVLPGDDLRSAFLTDHLRPYQARLRIALDEGQGAETLWQLDRFRARALHDQPDAGPVLQAAADTATDSVIDNPALALRERLNWLYRRLQKLHDEGASSVALSAEMQRTEHDLLERARRQRLLAPSASDGATDQGLAAGSARRFSVQALQSSLQPADALLEYGVLDDELFACVATRDQVILFRHLAPYGQVQEAIRALRFQIEALSAGAAALQPHMALLTARTEQRLARLTALIWAPLQGALANAQRLLLVPQGLLCSVPFAALPLVDSASAPSTTLGQRYQLACAPSARAAWRGLLRPPTPALRVLALGESSRLVHAAAEARAVAAAFAQGRAWVGEQATLAVLRAHAPQADVLHLACHAQFRSDNPRFGALHLADSALTVEQVEGLRLRPCTVVLSACDSALADEGRGDEQVGLVRAFLLAGAARVVASLWPVDDAVTANFMDVFYAHLVAGQAPAKALQAAQALVRQNHPHPCFWAAFTLYGAW